MTIASVSSLLPSLEHPGHGLFVARRLAALGKQADVRVLHPVPWFPFIRPYSAARRWKPEAGSQLRVTDQRMFYFPRFLKSHDGAWLKRSVLPTLRRWKDEAGIELIDAHFAYPEGLGCVEAGKQLALPVFVTLRGVEQELVDDRMIGPMMIDSLKSAAGCIAVSESLRDCVVSRGVPASQVTVIPNAVDSDVFRPADRATVRSALKVPIETPLIVSVGHFKPVKQQQLLVNAFAEVCHRLPDARLVLIGGTQFDPAFTAEVRDRVREHRLEANVEFVGEMKPTDVARWLQAADVFAMASRREGCCNAVLEALACQVQVVATDVGDNARFITAKRGYVVAPNDSTALAEGLTAALASRHEIDWVGRGAGRTWDDVAQETVAYFKECTGIDL